MQAHHRSFSTIVVLATALATAVSQGVPALGADTDNLTGLPVYPGAPLIEKLPDGFYCGSQMRGNFYMPKGNDATYVSWYDARLLGFKKYHSMGHNRPQDAYFKPDGTMVVNVTGSVDSIDVYAVAYETFKPALSKTAMASFNQNRQTCR